jgi:hypothetical protein
MTITAHPQLLGTFPLIRTHSVEEACDRIGRVFSPHRLKMRSRRERLVARVLDLTCNIGRFDSTCADLPRNIESNSAADPQRRFVRTDAG